MVGAGKSDLLAARDNHEGCAQNLGWNKAHVAHQTVVGGAEICILDDERRAGCGVSLSSQWPEVVGRLLSSPEG